MCLILAVSSMVHMKLLNRYGRFLTQLLFFCVGNLEFYCLLNSSHQAGQLPNHIVPGQGFLEAVY